MTSWVAAWWLASSPVALAQETTVRKGESLQSISQRLYGTSRRWKEIYAWNRDRLPSPDSVRAGMRLRLQEKAAEKSAEKAPAPPAEQMPLVAEVVPEARPGRINRSPPRPPAQEPATPRDERQWQMRLAFWQGLENYSVAGSTGSSFNAKLSNADAKTYTGEIRTRQGTSGWALHYAKSKSEFTSPAGNFPSAFGSENVKAFVDRLSWEREGTRLVRYGLEYRNKKSVYTYPNTLQTDQTQLGLRAGYGFLGSFGSAFLWEILPAVFVPVLFQEGTVKSGSYSHGGSAELRLNAVYVVSPRIDFSLGAWGQFQKFFFLGSGGRGLTDARETSWSMALPVELRFKF
ncbi:MAG: LysM peptidoglycan-binding domain-containing protein [Bdellovibrionales bacterium]|nr:LysM peptidoglycan-binding domain-containing protein [Bdellovibrionales bacterium]